MKQTNTDSLGQIIDRLCENAAQQKNDELRGIASVGKDHFVIFSRVYMNRFVGLKTVVLEVNATDGRQVCGRIIPRLLTMIPNVKQYTIP